MGRRKIPDGFREFMSKMGKIGGKCCLETMTPEERHARAKKAVAAREAKRKVAAKREPK